MTTTQTPEWTAVRDRAYAILTDEGVDALDADTDVWQAACARARAELAATATAAWQGAFGR